MLVIPEIYHPVNDDHYVPSETMGALVNSAAIRAALQISLKYGAGIFHVHVHEHLGIPRPSLIDRIESNKFVPDFFNVTPHMPHGAIILSMDAASGVLWQGKTAEPREFEQIQIIGAPIRLVGKAT